LVAVHPKKLLPAAASISKKVSPTVQDPGAVVPLLKLAVREAPLRSFDPVQVFDPPSCGTSAVSIDRVEPPPESEIESPVPTDIWRVLMKLRLSVTLFQAPVLMATVASGNPLTAIAGTTT
jgi:hypothetical protein